MAPMGILTAVVAAIRVCGSPSLRAFIGRAQEGGGNSEAELSSSTSRDVCELYNNGGIARVFGRPKILEVIFDPDNQDFTDGTAGIYTFQEYVAGKMGKKNWFQTKYEGSVQASEITRQLKAREAGLPISTLPAPEPFAPNLSLNVDIRKRDVVIFRAVAVVGFILQGGVLAFAGVVAYYLEWEKNGSGPERYACPLVLVGTVLVCGGGQVIGDQTFDAFAHADSDDPQTVLKEYTVSWKKADLSHGEAVVWATVVLTLAGFVLQFTGLRAIHSAVAVAQLGAIMVMSLARAALRMQRLKSEAHKLRDFPDQVIGHELDWLALRIAQPDMALGFCNLGCYKTSGYLWAFDGNPTPGSNISPITPPEPTFTPDNRNPAAKVLTYRTRLAQLTMSPLSESKSLTLARHFHVELVEVRRVAGQLAAAMEVAANAMFSISELQKNWGYAKLVGWEISCQISDRLVASLFASQKQNLIVQFDKVTALLDSINGPWALYDPLELESILGLWLWSIKSVSPSGQGPVFAGRPTGSTSSRIEARRIVTADVNVVRREVKFWIPSRLLHLIPGDYLLPPVEGRNPSTFWLHLR
ncbi:hypothetical protein BJX62DRAFT_243560 [Aspergillus germanicus]